jgi:protoporphyrinogen oxidase
LSDPHCIAIGAGPAGLSAAYELRRLGIRATVLEAGAEIGGLARTASHRGYRFDIGGHRFYTKHPEIDAIWTEVLGEAFLERPRLSRIHYRGHYFDYPLRPGNAVAGLGLVESLRVIASYARIHLWPPQGPDRSFEEWVSRRFGPRLFQIFFKTYTEKVWGIPCTQLSADWAVQRIKDLSLPRAVHNAITGKNGGGGREDSATLIDRFRYPRQGPGQLWERMALQTADAGGEIVSNVRVGTVCHNHGHVDCVHARGPDGERIEIAGDHFLSSMALRDLVLAMDPLPPNDVLRAAHALGYRDFLTVALIVDRAEVFPDNWIYIHSPEVKLGRIQNYKNWSPHMVPNPGTTALGLEYFLWDSDPEWSWPDERLIELGVRECAALGLIRPSEVVDGTVLRAEMAYPIYHHEYRHHVGIIRDYLAGFDNLQTIGRNGLHRYNNMDHSMLTGLYAARNVAGAGLDVWSVNTDSVYLESGRRGHSDALQ